MNDLKVEQLNVQAIIDTRLHNCNGQLLNRLIQLLRYSQCEQHLPGAVQGFRVKSPESNLARSHVARNQSHVAQNL